MDPVHFTGKEVLDMAIKIEENGLKYYTDAAKASRNEKLKEVFKALANEECDHIKVFSELKKSLFDKDYQEGFDAYAEEAALYLSAIADTEVFTNPDKGRNLAQQVKDEKDAVRIALDMEKDSLLFYYEILKMVRDRDRAVVENLIEQEKNHVKKLTGLQKCLP
ncbi:MAG: ferritin family protein [Deltaproteobacteria bacterium]